MTPQQKIAQILGVTEKTVADFEKVISASTGQSGVLDKIILENDRIISETLQKIHTADGATAGHIRGDLQKAIFYQEKQFLDFLRSVEGQDEFEKAAQLARSLTKDGRGFFLKKEVIKEVLNKRRPDNLLNYLGYTSVEQLLAGNDVMEAFSALRFVETNEWMHQTFEKCYSGLGREDFEERNIEIKVMSPKWRGIAQKFIEKKHHNVSHLKEFGVIFLNPEKMDIPGKFLRDFALLLHYFHEIDFYSRLFKKYSAEPDFANRFKALLRGDVKEIAEVKEKNAWLIVQRYLVKENPNDSRLYQPRVNPESLHWSKGERDLASIAGLTNQGVDLSMWLNLDWVGGIFKDGDPSTSVGAGEVVSFDLEDNAMSLVASMEGEPKFFSYHQREAMWTRIFAEYAGGEEKLEQLIMDNFDKGYISL